jgi:hypothetical protein
MAAGADKRSGQLDDRDDHADENERDDRDLHPYPALRHAVDSVLGVAAVAAPMALSAAPATIVVAMGRKIAALAAGLLLTLLSATTALAADANPASSASSRRSALLGGVNIGGLGNGSSGAEADSAIAYAHALHAKVVRTNVEWSAFEPSRQGALNPGVLAVADRLVSDASSAGIRVIMDVESTPCWASSAPTPLLGSCRPGSESAATAWPPVNAASYAAFVAYLARRYGPHLAAIEVWNEPDQANEAYWAGPEKAARYAALLRAAYPAIKAVDPSVPVLAGSLVGSNGAFLRLLYADGIKGYYDGLSVHYYTLTLDDLRSIHETQLANGDTKPLWLDEFGWTSCLPREQIEQEQQCVTAKIQARNLSDTLRALARSPFVAAAVVYKLRDSRTEDFGMLSASGARKPSFAAFAGAMSAPFGGISPVTLRLRRRGTQVLASGSGPVGDVMRMEAFQGKVLRFWATFGLNRFNDYSIELPAVLGTHGLRVRVFQYWSGPSKAAQKTI